MNATDKSKIDSAKPEVLKLVKRHGLRSVQYVVNKLTQQERLRRELSRVRKNAEDRIAEIQKKL